MCSAGYWNIICFSSHRVFITNLQKEIEKQTGYRSTRKRRSASQYDYEVYHSLEEVHVGFIICYYHTVSHRSPESRYTPITQYTVAPNTQTALI